MESIICNRTVFILTCKTSDKLAKKKNDQEFGIHVKFDLDNAENDNAGIMRACRDVFDFIQVQQK